MLELRWKVETWEEWVDGSDDPIKHTEKPVLQFRRDEGPTGESWPGEWKDVPVEYV